MSGPATGTGIGQPVRRKEDLRFITGQGQYTDDLKLPGQVYAAMVRSPHAHAVIRSIDTAAAKAVPGVIAVFTGRDWLADGLKSVPNKTFSWHPAEIALINTDGTPPFNAPDFPLPFDKALRPGSFAEARFNAAASGALTVPASAIRYEAGGPSVMLVGDGNRVKQVAVKLGERAGDYVQLVEGPPAGSRVLAVGASFTLDGDVIQPVEEGVASTPAAPGGK